MIYRLRHRVKASSVNAGKNLRKPAYSRNRPSAKKVQSAVASQTQGELRNTAHYRDFDGKSLIFLWRSRGCVYVRLFREKNVRENGPSNEISWSFYGVNRVAEITQDSADTVSLNSTCPL